MQEILEVLQELIQDNFDDDTIILTADTSFEEIEDWDSMEQVNVITMIEEHYGFKFNVNEMTAMSNACNAGRMAEIISEKLG